MVENRKFFWISGSLYEYGVYGPKAIYSEKVYLFHTH